MIRSTLSNHALNRRSLVEPAGGVRQHGVDLAGIGGQIIACDCRIPIAARNVVKEPFKFVDVMFHCLAKLRIGAVLVANFLECPLPLAGVEALCERAAFAPFIPLPES